MEKSSDFPHFSNGVAASLFDGNKARPVAVFLRLNLASLSRRVSIDISKVDDETEIFISGSIQEFRILNPASMVQARGNQHGEMWLQYRHIQLRVHSEKDRKILLSWFRQFAKKHVWRGHRNAWWICFASLLTVGFSFASTLAAALGASALLDITSAKPKPALWLEKNLRMQPNETTKRTICNGAHLQTYVASLAAQLGFEQIRVIPLPKSPQLRPTILLSKGRLGIATETFSQLPSADIFMGSLALSLAEHQAASIENNRLEQQLQNLAAQTTQLRLTPNITSLMTGHLLASYQARLRSEGLDLLAIDILTDHGFDPQAFVIALDYFNTVPDPSNIEQQLPTIFRSKTSNQKRLSTVRSGLSAGTFKSKAGAKRASTKALKHVQSHCRKL